MKKFLSPRSLFILTLLSVFLLELIIMLVFRQLPELPAATEAVLDAIILSVVFVPFLYLLFLKPYQNFVRISSEADSERRKSEELNRMKSEIISIAAHELRTPLTAITGYAELLQMNTPGDEESRQNYIEIILRKADVMDRLINELLDLSRIDRGDPLIIQPQEEDIVALTAAVVTDYRARHPHRTFTLDLPDRPVVMSIDRVRIEQVLDNLLSNAVRFSSDDTLVEVIGRCENRSFCWQICDGGIGMTAEQANRVFEKFYRADTSDTSSAGLGLGMALVKQIVVAHKGDIRLSSTPGAGTRVIVTLPIG